MGSLIKNKKVWMKIAIVIGFLITYYLVELGPWGSASVVNFSGGYGTFDMKKYDVATVYSVLGQYTTEGFTRIKYYYLCDYIFIVGLLAVQVMLASLVYKKIKSTLPRKLFVLVAIIRGIADSIENALLLYIISAYPNPHDTLVNMASLVTQVKFIMVAVCGILLLVGIACNFIRFKQEAEV